MASPSETTASRPPAPPPPPPPPPPPQPRSQVSLKTRNTASSPDDVFYRPPPPTLATDAPTGPYFVYGSLMDPDMLADILRHKHRPTLRPAELTGYSCKLWGQYPALQESQDGEGGAAIRGMVYRVPSVAEGARLAEYETSSYRARPCQIQYTDGRQPAEENGHVFVFVGNPRDLDEGTFDLAAWLERMGR